MLGGYAKGRGNLGIMELRRGRVRVRDGLGMAGASLLGGEARVRVSWMASIVTVRGSVLGAHVRVSDGLGTARGSRGHAPHPFQGAHKLRMACP